METTSVILVLLVYLDLWVGLNGQAECDDKQKLGGIYTHITDQSLQNLAKKVDPDVAKSGAKKWIQMQQTRRQNKGNKQMQNGSKGYEMKKVSKGDTVRYAEK